MNILVHKDPWQPWNLPWSSLLWWNPPGWHMDRTFTTGITGGITIGITITGITGGIIMVIMGNIMFAGTMVEIIVDILPAAMLPAGILRADIVGVVNMQSMEVVGDGGGFGSHTIRQRRLRPPLASITSGPDLLCVTKVRPRLLP